ncbi:TadE/TadG family type IV pilus assembly protein [Methylobacterium sp. A54F]
MRRTIQADTAGHSAGLSAGRLIGRVRRLVACRAGLSGVEFAILAPILVVILLGSVDASRAVTAANRASFVADSIAELVSQAQTKDAVPLTEAAIDGFLRSAPLIDPDILAYGRQIGSTDLPALANVTLSSVAFTRTQPTCTVSCTYAAATIFSRALSGSLRPCGVLLPAPDGAATTALTLPASAFGPVSLVVVDVEVFFKPLFPIAFPFPNRFRRSAYFRPRQVTQVKAPTNCPGF